MQQQHRHLEICHQRSDQHHLVLVVLQFLGQSVPTSLRPVLRFVVPCCPHSSGGKESACNAGDPGSIPGSGRSTGGRINYPLQYSQASLVVKNLLAMRKTWVGKIPWRRERLPTPVFWPGEFQGL